ncbi:uncharacterized protein LOC134710401 [Mytilus trossulus]|uniref:uncharacterized protein LOC134710401 n=1 Tax=Mytilus trossulus TaxID=6551 RepID=UPI003004CBDA
MWIKLEKDFFGFQKDLYMCVVYNPPSMSSYTQGLDRDITECLEQETAKYMKMGNVLLCGDFNARIANSPDYILNDDQSYLPLFDNYPIDKQILKRQSSDTTIDSRGKSLLDLCILNQLRILNGRVLGDVFGKYTCYTPNGSSVVDYVMVSESILDQILYFYVHNFMPTISDCHCILEWEMSSKFTVDDNDCNINLFDKSPNFIWSDESPTNFQTALLLPDIQTQINTFNKMRGHYYKLNKQYSKLRKFKYKEYKKSLVEQLQNLHDDNPKSYWKLINDLKNNDNKDHSSAVAPSVWVSHFNGLYQLHESFKERVAKLEKKLDNLEKNVCFNNLDKLITEKEISFAISKLRCNKSPGLDNISNNMIKHSQNVLLSSLSKIFNSCLSHGLYPRNWTEGYITVLHKSGEVTDPNNYRGLTITNAIGKLFNSILNIRLDSFLEENNVINDCQIGFTRKARTSDHMFVLKCIFDKYCNTKDGRVFACFVDFHKAFDKVIHTGIRIKLLEIGVSSRFYSVIKNMYLETRSCIKIHDRIAEFFQTKLGVKQGDNLSPNLFKIFINSLPDYFTQTRDPIMLDGKLIHCLMYADDIVILSNSAEGLQEKLNELHNFCNDWCLDINTKKTKVLIFNKAGRHISQKFIFNKDELECVSNYKYLDFVVYYSKDKD